MFGGGTDHPKWFKENGGSVVSFSINKYCYINLRELPPFFSHKFRVAYSRVEVTQQAEDILHPAVRKAFTKYANNLKLELHHHGDLPAQSGVGSSSAFAVGLIKSLFAIKNLKIDNLEIAKEAINFEQKDLLETVGSQDQIACAVGGINYIEFQRDELWKVNKINLADKGVEDLESRIVLIYTGIPRLSSDISDGLLDKIETKSKLMIRTKELAEEFNQILLNNNDLNYVTDMLKESWEIKKNLNPYSVTDTLENFYQMGIRKGAKAGKILGAGGGGFFLFWVEPNSRENFIKSMSSFVHVPVKIDFEGCTQVL
jgi:D-glycero-alpha-D-manno-heptose-7-phosphate kinase